MQIRCNNSLKFTRHIFHKLNMIMINTHTHKYSTMQNVLFIQVLTKINSKEISIKFLRIYDFIERNIEHRLTVAIL